MCSGPQSLEFGEEGGKGGATNQSFSMWTTREFQEMRCDAVGNGAAVRACLLEYIGAFLQATLRSLGWNSMALA